MMIIILAVLLLVPAHAMAQEGPQRIAQVREAARTHVGPFLLSPTLMVSNVGIDDNVLLDPKTGSPLSDFSATVTPGVRGWLPVAHRALFNVDVSTGLVWFQDFKGERSVNPNLGGAAEIFVGRLTFTGGASFSQSSDRPSLEIDARSLQRGRGVHVGAAYQLRPKLGIQLTAHRNSVRFADGEEFLGTELRQTLNRDADEFRISFTQTLTPKTRVHLRATTERTRFEFSPDRNTDGFRITPAVTFAANALISGTAEIGYGRLNPRNPAVPNYSGLVGAVDLSYAIRDSTRFTAGWLRDIEYSFQPSTPYYVKNGFLGRVRRQIAGRFDAIVGFARHQHGYPDNAETPEVDEQSEVAHVYSADVGFRLSKYARLGVAAETSDRVSSTNAVRTYDRLRVGMTFTYGL